MRTAIIGIRVTAQVKQRLAEEAEKRGRTLTAFLYEIINTGLKQMGVKQDKVVVKQENAEKEV